MTTDALVQMSNSSFLTIMIVLYLISIAFYNFFGLSVTKQLTGHLRSSPTSFVVPSSPVVHRTLIDALRTIVVWVANLAIFYIVGGVYGMLPVFAHSAPLINRRSLVATILVHAAWWVRFAHCRHVALQRGPEAALLHLQKEG